MANDGFGDKRHAGFPKGVSGNPGGRSKVDKRFGEVWDKRTEHPGLDGIEKAAALLGEIAFSQKELTRDRLRAIELWLAYRVGKPKEHVEVSGGITREAQALLEALHMTPHERRLAAATQDATAAEDDSAAAELEAAVDPNDA